MAVDIKKPTLEQCSVQEKIEISPGVFGYACWYPQMGGYVGRCVMIPLGGCFDVYVWHDGEFPFQDNDERSPAHLHHCMGEQFIEFGELALRLNVGVSL